MRRFSVHLVTEIDFVDGDEASDAAAQNYQNTLRTPFRTRPRGSRSGQSRLPGSRRSRSQKSRMNSSNPRGRVEHERKRPQALRLSHPNPLDRMRAMRPVRPLRHRKAHGAAGDDALPLSALEDGSE